MSTADGLPARLAPTGAARPAPGIVHLGIGAFFRAFGIPWIAEAMQIGGGDWGVIGVSLRNPAIRDALRDQGFAYTAVALAPDGPTPHQIEALRDILVAPEDPAAVLAAMADPATRIVSLTVTEKGYCHNPALGTLDLQHPDIQHDIKSPLPRSAPGFLVRALQMRHSRGQEPFTVLSCDNLPHNGALTRRVVLALAGAIDPDLADWVARSVSFPATMVDKIVPATTPADITATDALTGHHDAAPVMHEPFRQWVIEDRFPAGRPDLAAVGVQLVQDVAPFELMKLRMLNGTHSALAYLGYLSGHATVAAAVGDPALRDFIKGLWRNEIIPTLSAPEGVNLQDYASALLARYDNPALRHATWQIAMDGSQKLPQRILGTLQDAYANGRKADGLLLVIAAWMRYVGGTDEAGQSIDVRDPLADRLRHLAQGPDPVAGLLTVTEVFAPALAAQLRDPLTVIYRDLCRLGARAMAQRMTT